MVFAWAFEETYNQSTTGTDGSIHRDEQVRTKSIRPYRARDANGNDDGRRRRRLMLAMEKKAVLFDGLVSRTITACDVNIVVKQRQWRFVLLLGLL